MGHCGARLSLALTPSTPREYSAPDESFFFFLWHPACLWLYYCVGSGSGRCLDLKPPSSAAIRTLLSSIFAVFRSRTHADKDAIPGVLQKWRRERGAIGSSILPQDGLTAAPSSAPVCERVVVFSKRDLVPEWGIKVGDRAGISSAR